MHSERRGCKYTRVLEHYIPDAQIFASPFSKPHRCHLAAANLRQHRAAAKRGAGTLALRAITTPKALRPFPLPLTVRLHTQG